MTLPLERARSRRPVTWLTLAGVLLLPVVIGGLLVAALYNPTERLDAMSTAIVNNDAPVEIDGQLAPLGRQLTAGLVEGSDEVPSNLDWTISNDEDAAAGLADGTYDAAVTIPENFSAAATSTAPGGTPEQATIEVVTSPDSLIVDDAITAQVTQTAASVMGEQLSTVYLENVFLGFTTLGDELGEAADGAAQLADGASQASDGAVSLAEGTRQISGGAGELATGAYGLGDGASQLASGASQAASGLRAWAAGAAAAAAGQQEWAAGATDAASGLQTWAGGATTLAGGQRQIADALALIAGQVPTDMPPVPQEVIDAADDISANGAAINQQLTDAATQLAELAAQCDAVATPDLCAGLTEAAQNAQDALPTVTGIVDQAGTIAIGLEGLNQLPALGAGLGELATQSGQIADGLDGLATGAQDAAGGVDQLASGAGTLAAGSQELSDGAAALAAGGDGLSSGAGQLASGAAQLGDGAGAFADGASQVADGGDDLAAGVGELATGTGTLADGLGAAVDQVPSYTGAEASDLASVVSNPVTAAGLGSSLFGASAVPLLTALALWFGALASFIALQAVPASALSSRRPSALLALRSLAPAAGIGAVQGFLVAGVVQLAADYTWGEWFAFAGLAMVAGVVFAAVNQALVAAFGGAGRWLAALVGVLAVATGVVSTVPGILSSVAALMPTTPAYNALLGALTAADGVAAGLVGMIVWALIAFGVTTLAVARRRATTARAVLAAQPA